VVGGGGGGGVYQKKKTKNQTPPHPKFGGGGWWGGGGCVFGVLLGGDLGNKPPHPTFWVCVFFGGGGGGDLFCGIWHGFLWNQISWGFETTLSFFTRHEGPAYRAPSLHLASFKEGDA